MPKRELFEPVTIPLFYPIVKGKSIFFGPKTPLPETLRVRHAGGLDKP